MMLAKNRLHQAAGQRPGLGSLSCSAVAEQPMPLAMAVFGLGLGLGVGVGLLISEAEFFPKAEQSSMIDRIVDSVSRLLPDAIAQHLSR